MHDLIIVGAGPAGSAAAVYAARKKIKTVLVAKEFGGQSVVSPDIQNWIGTPHIEGAELAKNLETHVREYANDCLTLEMGAYVTKVEKTDGSWRVTTDTGKNFEARALLSTAGGERRKLQVPGAAKFDNKGVTYCASCDGPLFAGANVAVIGGGNAGFETAAQLLAYAKSVTLLQRSDTYKADAITVDKVLSHKNMNGILNAEIMEVKGDAFVNSVIYKDSKSGETKELAVSGVFVEIGMIPNTQFLEGLVELDQYKRVVVDHTTQRTSASGVWAAGDCTNGLYHQNNIAAGDAVKALEDIYLYLNAH